MKTYDYSGDYFEITTSDPLEEEGILKGHYGELHYRRCKDGISIVDSAFLGCGFVDWPTSADFGAPRTINEIPVTELHKTVCISSTDPIAIEGGLFKRIYLDIRKMSPEELIDNMNNPLGALILLILQDQSGTKQDKEFTEIKIDFCNNEHSVDYCEIRCNGKCILNGINAKHLRIKADTVVLKGHAYSELETAEFSGKVYPFVDNDWDGEFVNLDFFSGAKHLRLVDGSLRGDSCWMFTNCTTLERVHLSNGIKNIPAHAFSNCVSLEDLYIPDTVTEIGEFAFSGCVRLKTVHLPTGIRSISKGMFRNCRLLTKCFLSDDIERIEDEAFAGCASLRKPWIPKAIQYISESAFDKPEWKLF